MKLAVLAFKGILKDAQEFYRESGGVLWRSVSFRATSLQVAAGILLELQIIVFCSPAENGSFREWTLAPPSC